MSRRAITTQALFLLSFAAFVASPVVQHSDSVFATLFSESVLRHHSVALNRYSIARLKPFSGPGIGSDGYPYQLQEVDGRLLYRYPHGSSLLSVPFVAILDALGISATGPDGHYYAHGEKLSQRILAGFLMAGLACVFLRTALLVLPPSWAMAVALGGTFGTQVWSTASRAMWSHTWLIFLLGWTVYLLLCGDEDEARLRPVLLATLLAWAYFVRPTAAIPIVAISFYILLFHRDQFAIYAATGGFWAVAFMLYSRLVFGTLLPFYFHYASLLTLDKFKAALAGHLVSPSRGLLVYVPTVPFVIYLVMRHWADLPHRRLAVLSLAVVAMHMAFISAWPQWWGGMSYGPRLSTDIVPWFVLLAVLGCAALTRDRERATNAFGAGFRRQSVVAVGMTLLVLSVLLNAPGALRWTTWYWNVYPAGVDDRNGRLWDWRDPQFLAGVSHRPKR